MSSTTKALVLAGMACLATSHVRAEGFSSTDLQLLYAGNSTSDPVNGTGTDNGKLYSGRLEHFGTFAYGDNYFFLDDYNGDDVGGKGAGSFGGKAANQQFAAYMPRLSLSKLFNHQLAWGPIKDVTLAARAEYASYGSYYGEGAGFSVDWNIPGFSYLITRVVEFKNNYNRAYPWLHVAWDYDVSVGPRKIRFEGYFWTVQTDTNGRRVYAEPDLTMDLDPKGTFRLGIRVQHDSYKLGNTGYDRWTPEAIFKWFF